MIKDKWIFHLIKYYEPSEILKSFLTGLLFFIFPSSLILVLEDMRVAIIVFIRVDKLLKVSSKIN